MSRILAIAVALLCQISYADDFLVRIKEFPSAASVFAQKIEARGMLVTNVYELVPGLIRVQGQAEDLTFLRNLPEVRYAERNHVRRATVVDAKMPKVSAVEPPIPDAISRPTEWKKYGGDTRNFGLYQSRTVEIFNKRKFYGSEKTVIAVVDTGVDYSHVDMNANMWRNPGESGDGKENNGVDDDGNGFVDDVVGWDFANSDNLPYDDYGHGTHVAGIAAAVGGNGYGISGHCARCSVMAIKFIGADGSGTDADAILGLEYATKMGAHVINSSWGSDEYSQALFDAFEATSQYGVSNTVAAGNNGVDLGFGLPPAYPAMFQIPGLLTVAALYEVHDFIPFWSNYGSAYVTFSFGGNAVYSLYPNNKYGQMSGTSMAAPGAAGVVGLMLSYRPNLTFEQIGTFIRKANMPDLQGMNKTRNGGRPDVVKVFKQMDAIPAE